VGRLVPLQQGVETNTHLSVKRFRLRSGFEAVHVPFKGGAEAVTEVMAGRRVYRFRIPHLVGIVCSREDAAWCHG